MSLELETVERAALEDMNAALDDDLATALGARSRAVGSAYASVLAALPASAIVANRAIGLGLAAPEKQEIVDALVDLYEEARVARYFVHVHREARPPAMVEWLQARGLERTRAWVKFRRDRSAPPRIDTDLDIRPATSKDAAAFARIEAQAFDLGPAAVPWLERLVGRPGWHVYMSFAGGEPVGAGVLHVHDGVGWLDWGATSPAHRGRGSQSALLGRRILAALDLGCRLIGTTTGEEVPGDPQVSYKNILKMGFVPAYVRDNFAPPRHAA